MPMICVLGVAKIGGVALGLRLGSFSPVASGTSKNNGTFERQKKKQLKQLMETSLLLLDLQLLLLECCYKREQPTWMLKWVWTLLPQIERQKQNRFQKYI